MTELKSMRKQLQHLLKKGKAENPSSWVSHIVRFSINNGDTEFVTCLVNQTQLAFDFLKENNADFILIEELGRVTMAYNWPYLQK